MTRHNPDLTPAEEHSLHERWISEIETAWAPLFRGCPDAVYIYIDDEHKTCNQAAADLFGMTVEQFKACESYLDECVAETSIDLVIHNYFQHFIEEMRPLSFEYVAKRHDGSTFPATAFNIPIVHDGQVVLLGFVRPREDGSDAH
jgi:PAS domain S-box-containing protein